MRSFRLPRTLPLPEGLRSVALYEAERAISHLRRGDVHQTRRSLKQLRALLALLRDDAAAAEINIRLRRVSRLLSPVRDREVALATWREIALPASTRRLLQPTIRALSALPPCLPPTALPQLQRACRALQRWEPFATRSQLRQQLLRTVRKTRSIYRTLEAGVSPPEAFHHLRRLFKRLAAQLDLLHDLAPSPLRSARKAAHRISERLGLDHDLVVLETLFPADQREWITPTLHPLHLKHQRAALRQAERFFNKTARAR